MARRRMVSVVLIVLGCSACVALLLACSGTCSTDPDHGNYREKVILEKKNWKLVERTHTQMQPNYIARRLVADGREVPLTRLAGLIGESYADLPVDEQITMFIRFHNVEETAVLDGFSSIDGFTPEQLDPDLRSLDGKPVEIEERGRVFRIAYTYQQMGGIIQRWKLRIAKNRLWGCENVMEIGRKAGKPQYRE